MIRVISSPSSSTIGFATLILAIERSQSHTKLPAGPAGAAPYHRSRPAQAARGGQSHFAETSPAVGATKPSTASTTASTAGTTRDRSRLAGRSEEQTSKVKA